MKKRKIWKLVLGIIIFIIIIGSFADNDDSKSNSNDKYNNKCNIVITDVRRVSEIDYINELKAIYGPNNVQLIEIIRPIENRGEFDYDSETSKAICYARFHNYVDITIHNVSSPEDLSKTTENVISHITENIK